MRYAFLLSSVLLCACSQQVQDRASDTYAPVFPAAPAATPEGLSTGAIFRGGKGGLFATDRRAAEVGDVLTVELTEDFAARKSQDASTAKTDSFSIDLPGPFDDAASLQSGTDQNFAGSGSASQSNSLRGRVSVNVVRKYPGGILAIMGQKKLTLNNGDEYIRLSGLVREADIGADNVIPSDRIANAEIKYIGAGQIADAGQQGWLREIMNTVSPF
ncbi:flagellar L-ring protein precursor FlgH [Rhodovulum bhavnagarense]|uniref:Flagellar L-ring protein n=1 Tax=Rhodovulum bhavnagarense TaxID=992286 RepID=A0A4V2SW74_9RHOB|nr:flagellar basal body L-ring protein FlgH [Rhodovulum bhavnagarense]TCP61346.1 flagellar L-ring protein precursor FlgH [Rhodovulum bhavnagarense]